MLTINAILDSRAGAAVLAFLRVAAAAAFGAWAMAGFPLSELTGGDVEQYLQAGLAAGAALVSVNAVGPWETRYGRKARALSVTLPPKAADGAVHHVTIHLDGDQIHRELLRFKRRRGGGSLGL